MREEINKRLAEMEVLAGHVDDGLNLAEKIGADLLRWFEEGKQLQANLETLVESYKKTLDRWDQLRGDILSRLDDADNADWWKST